MKNLNLLRLVILALIIAQPSYSQNLNKYDFVDYFKDGIAPAKKDQNWGFVSNQGKTIVAPKYDFVFRFNESLARVVKYNKWGLINKKGYEIIPLEYDYIGSFEDGLARAYKDEHYTFIDTDGEVAIKNQFIYANKFQNGVAITAKNVKSKYNHDSPFFGLINTKGEILADYKYEMLDFIKNGLYKYSVDSKTRRNYDYSDEFGFLKFTENGLVEKSHDEVNVDYLQTFKDAKVYEKTKNPLEAEKLLQKLNIPFDEVAPVYEQSAVFVNNNLVGFVNLHNETIVQAKFDKAADFLIDGLLEVKLNDEYFFVDKTGQKANINLNHFIQLSDDSINKYGLHIFYDHRKRGDFDKLLQPTPPSPPPPPSPIYIEEEIEVEEELIIEADDIYDEDIETIEVEPDYEEENTNIPFALVEEAPIYPGCDESTSNDEIKICTVNKISKFIHENFNISIAKELNLNGVNRIYVIFEINKEGHIDNLNIRSSHTELASEAERVMKLLPQLKPGKQNNKAVNVIYTMPITFQIP